MKKIFTLHLLLLTASLSYAFGQFQYLSPKPGSEMISIEHNIIIREGSMIETASLKPELFSIIGSGSGAHEFNLILADDGKTILLQPETHFAYNEEVTVFIQEGLSTKQGRLLNAYSFSFKTHREYSAEEQQHFKELKTEMLEEENKSSAVEATPESDTRGITGMFDITINNNPSPGDIFYGAFSGFFQANNFTGYHVITNNGDSVFSREIMGTFNFLQHKSGYFGVFNSYKDRFELLDSNFIVIDEFYPANGYEADEHEFQSLPNGHVFIIAGELQVMDLAIYNPSYSNHCSVYGTVIQEFDANHNLVFEWRSFDHVEVTEALHANLTFGSLDYVHTNSIEIDNDGNILASHRHLDQVTKIDRNTGEFIWRLGGVKNDFAFINEPEPFTYQHDARRIANGNITLFDNGNYHSPARSAAKEYQLDEVNKTATLVWEYFHPGTTPDIYLYYSAMGSVQRLEDGHTFINWGARATNILNPSMTEVTPDGTIVWELILSSEKNMTAYRSHKYEWDPCSRATFKWLSTKDITDHSAKLKWAPVANAISYLVQYKKHNNTTLKEKTVDASAHSLKLPDLDADSEYDWRVQTWCDTDGNKKSGFTDVRRFTTLAQKAVLTEVSDVASFEVYPNPVHEVINVRANNSAISHVQLLNMLGRTMITLSINEKDCSLIELPVLNLLPGSYLLEISSGGKKCVKKVVIE